MRNHKIMFWKCSNNWLVCMNKRNGRHVASDSDSTCGLRRRSARRKRSVSLPQCCNGDNNWRLSINYYSRACININQCRREENKGERRELCWFLLSRRDSFTKETTSGSRLSSGAASIRSFLFSRPLATQESMDGISAPHSIGTFLPGFMILNYLKTFIFDVRTFFIIFHFASHK